MGMGGMGNPIARGPMMQPRMMFSAGGGDPKTGGGQDNFGAYPPNPTMGGSTGDGGTGYGGPAMGAGLQSGFSIQAPTPTMGAQLSPTNIPGRQLVGVAGGQQGRAQGPTGTWKDDYDNGTGQFIPTTVNGQHFINGKLFAGEGLSQDANPNAAGFAFGNMSNMYMGGNGSGQLPIPGGAPTAVDNFTGNPAIAGGSTGNPAFGFNPGLLGGNPAARGAGPNIPGMVPGNMNGNPALNYGAGNMNGGNPALNFGQGLLGNPFARGPNNFIRR